MAITEIRKIPKRKAHLFLIMEKTEDAEVKKTIESMVEDFIFFASYNDEEDHLERIVYTYSYGSPSIAPYTDIYGVDKSFNIECNCSGNTIDMTNLFKQLDRDMSRRKLMNAETGVITPTVVILANGSESYSGKKALDKLIQNKWFYHAKRLVITCNDKTKGSNKIFESFTGDDEAVLSHQEMNTYGIASVFNRIVIKRRQCTTGHLIPTHRRILRRIDREDNKCIVSVDDNVFDDQDW